MNGSPSSAPDIASMTREEIAALLSEMGEPSYRAGQLFSRLHAMRTFSYDEMTELPSALRKELSAAMPLPYPRIERKAVSKEDGTVKYLFVYADGSPVEAVLMRYRYGLSLCISSQVGCRMHCSFCASGIRGLVRSLSAGEMLGEVYAAGRDAGERIGHVVVMGTGEPLDNYDQLVRFLSLLRDANGAKLGGRHVAVSTCGIVPRIRDLSKERFTGTLALSLHAADDETRRSIMPVAKRYTVDETIGAMRDYAETTGRRVTFEYALIGGVNDRERDAVLLAEKLRGIPCLVNLIPVNPVDESGYRPPRPAEAARFKKSLEKSGINVTIRREIGRDINGACGQLRLQYIRDNEEGCLL